MTLGAGDPLDDSGAEGGRSTRAAVRSLDRADRSRGRARALGAAALVGVVGVGGFVGWRATQSPAGLVASAPSTGVSAGAAESTAGASSIVVGTASVATSAANDIDKRRAVSLTSCAATSTGAKAAGVIHHPGTSKATYQIAVIFTSASATVLGSEHVTVSAKPGDTTFEAKASFPTDPGVICVLGPIT